MSITRDRAAEDYVAQAINDFQSETAELTGRPAPPALRATVYVLGAMVLVLIGLMAIGELERVVVASGRVVSEETTLMVQPFETSVVRTVEVAPGQLVSKGDLLATLDPTFSDADVATLQNQEERLRAEIDRLEAERDGAPFDPQGTSAAYALQRSIWLSRQAEYASTIAKSEQLIEDAQITINRATDDVKHFRKRLDLAQDVEGMRKELERLKVGSRLLSVIATDGRVEMSRNLAEAQSTISSAKSDMEVRASELEVFRQKWAGDVLRDLLDRRSEHDLIVEQLAKAEKRREMVELKAESDAVVLYVSDFSVGSVVQPGEKMFSLVPIGDQMFVEADIDAADQGFLRPGQEVRVKFSAYPFVKHGTAEGVIRTISADSFSRTEDDRDIDKGRLPERFFRARIDITKLDLHDVPQTFKIVPGMPVESDIIVGEHTILSYLLEGAMRSTAEGLREP